MNNDHLIAVCLAAVKHYGKENQQRKAVEELAELALELCREPIGRSGKDRIAEEIADVEIMLRQLVMIHNCQGEVDEYIEKKSYRLADRIVSESHEAIKPKLHIQWEAN